jgi:hypothetical protein
MGEYDIHDINENSKNPSETMEQENAERASNKN